MQITIQLDPESISQLEAIQKYTNQDRHAVIQQGISLYYQQIQARYEIQVAMSRQYELVCNGSANPN